METQNKKHKIVIDLLVIFVVTAIPLAAIMTLGQKRVLGLVSGQPLMIRTLYTVFIQFSTVGLGIILVVLFRREKFSGYGLKKEGAIRSLLYGAALTLVCILFEYFINGSLKYAPFKEVNLTPELIKAGFPVSIIGMAFVAIAWGFFEAFNYVYISKKMNELINIKNPFLRIGPILMGISCIFVHGAVGQSMLSALWSFFIIYFMLIIPELIGNSWGCILIFILFWNAV